MAAFSSSKLNRLGSMLWYGCIIGAATTIIVTSTIRNATAAFHHSNTPAILSVPPEDSRIRQNRNDPVRKVPSPPPQLALVIPDGTG